MGPGSIVWLTQIKHYSAMFLCAQGHTCSSLRLNVIHIPAAGFMLFHRLTVGSGTLQRNATMHIQRQGRRRLLANMDVNSAGFKFFKTLKCFMGKEKHSTSLLNSSSKICRVRFSEKHKHIFCVFTRSPHRVP